MGRRFPPARSGLDRTGHKDIDVSQIRSRWPARIVMVGSRLRKRSRMLVAPCASPCPTPPGTPDARRRTGPDPRNVKPLMIPTATTAREHRQVMTVHAAFECALANLIQPTKLKGHPSTIGEDEPVKHDGEPFLIWPTVADADPTTRAPRGITIRWRSAE